MTDVMKFFGMRVGEFRKEWAALTPEDKTQLINGVKDGSLTYE